MKSYCDVEGFKFCKTSAETGDGIHEMFNSLASDLLTTNNHQHIALSTPISYNQNQQENNTVDINTLGQGSGKCGCCH
jgi:hypothetical protein